MLRIWIRQEGVSETEALKISLSKDSHISDLIVLAAPLFRFHKDLRASELQLVKCDEGRTILSNRHLLCELDEEDVIIRPKDSSAQVVLGKFKTKFVSETAHPAERKNGGKEIAADSKTVLLKKQLTPQVEGKLEVTTKKHVKQASATEPDPSSSSAQGAGKNQRGASNTHTHPQKNPVRYEPSETSKCESVTQSVVNSLSALSMATADERTSKEAVKHPKHIKKESQRRSTTSIKTDIPTDMKVEVEFHTDPGNVPQTDKKVNPDLQTASHRSLNNMKNSDKSTPKSNEKETATSRVVCNSFSPRWGLPAACRICGHMKPMHVPTNSSGGKESKLETKDMPVHQPIDSEASDSTLQPDPDTSRRSKICRTRRNLKSDAYATAFLDDAIITKRVDSNLVSSDAAPEHPREKSPYASPYPPDFSPHREDDAEEENEFMFSECADVCDTRTRSVVCQLNENQKSHSDSEPTRPGGNNTSSKKKKRHKRKK